MFAKELNKVMVDIKTAPDIKKARRVTVHVDILPGNMTEGGLDDVVLGVQVVSKTPARSAAGTMTVGLGTNTSLTFEADLVDSDPRQSPLFSEEARSNRYRDSE